MFLFYRALSSRPDSARKDSHRPSESSRTLPVGHARSCRSRVGPVRSCPKPGRHLHAGVAEEHRCSLSRPTAHACALGVAMKGAQLPARSKSRKECLDLACTYSWKQCRRVAPIQEVILSRQRLGHRVAPPGLTVRPAPRLLHPAMPPREGLGRSVVASSKSPATEMSLPRLLSILDPIYYAFIAHGLVTSHKSRN